MDLPTNTFKAALRAGRTQIGIRSSLPDPTAAEHLAGCGYDWMMFDTEHSPAGPNEVIGFLRTVAPYPVSPVALLIPYVQSAEEARSAVAAVTDPPKACGASPESPAPPATAS